METRFDPILKKWAGSAAFIHQDRPILILSKKDLGANALQELQSDLIQACGDELLSCILSLKMMHIYFRMDARTIDYRPHRGPFSGVVDSEYRVANTDRAEALIYLTKAERERLLQYIANIAKSPKAVLGQSHALQIGEPDFTVREHLTEGRLDRNAFTEESVRHNCLTWMTTAPIGENGEALWELIGMSPSDLDEEAHSYIVPFYRFLIGAARSERVPAVVIWTNSDAHEMADQIRENPDQVLEFYGVPNTVVV